MLEVRGAGEAESRLVAVQILPIEIAFGEPKAPGTVADRAAVAERRPDIAGTGAINAFIDDAYRAKYRSSPYLAPMISARTRAAIVKISPRGN